MKINKHAQPVAILLVAAMVAVALCPRKGHHLSGDCRPCLRIMGHERISLAITCHWMFAIAPPLIVTFVELSKPSGTLRRKSGRIFVLLLPLFPAYAGTHVLQWPVWVSAALSMVSVYLFFHTLRLSFPPAAALALLPTIIPAKRLWSYPWHVAIGSAAFILVSLLWFKQPKPSVLPRKLIRRRAL